MRCHQQAPTWVDVERAAVDTVRLGMIDQRRLASLLVDQIGREGVFAADEDFLTVDFRRGVGTIDAVHEAAVRVHVHRARGLP